MTFKNRIRGYRAKGMGDAFENLFKSSCYRENTICIRVPNGGQMYRDRFGNKNVRLIRSPFDFLITRDGKSACIDAKTVEGSTFPFSAIEPHQVDSLLEVNPSINSGYVVWFRELDAVIFFSANQLKALRPKDSLKAQDGLLLGKMQNFNPGKIFEWVDDGKQLLQQQRIF